MVTEDTHFIFSGLMGTSSEAVLRVQLRQFSGTYQLRARALLDDGTTWINTNWFAISNASHLLEVSWQAATGSGTNNGGLAFWIDGAQAANLTGLDNDRERIDRVRLGGLAGVDTGTRGTYYFDAFESRRQTYIGPSGGGGSNQFPTSTALPVSTSTALPLPTSTAVTTVVPPPVSTATPVAGSIRIAYAASTDDIANPDRGFMKQISIFPDQAFDPAKIKALQPTDTLVWIYFRLDNYRNRPLDQNGLNTIRSAFSTARSKGLKLVIRFVYNDGPGSTTDPNLANPDAPIDLVLQHIDQLKPILTENADVIAVLEAGFVGHWGEWHSTKYLHPLEYRKAIVDALLQALPQDRMLQLRYPRYNQIFFQGPLTASEAFSGTDRSRVGQHNDCFLRDLDDGGTYKSTTGQLPRQTSTYCDGRDEVACWKDYTAQQGQFTPVGGETCQYNPPRTDCPNALQELKTLHWSFLNNGYKKEVLDSWVTGGCMNTIRRSLGYRLVLKEASLPPSTRPGSTLSMNIKLSNDGFAAMYNPHPLYLVLLGTSTRYEIPVSNVDARRWAAGQEQNIAINVTLPANVAPGTYKLGLWLPDVYQSLRGNPAYSVRFANTNVWDAATGINLLTTTFQVQP
jgi:Domain of unknown function (DUF4832)/Domain of unknown function (DUF4874)